MMVCMRPSGTAEQLEKRRRRAIALLRAGTPYREVAPRVAASLSSVVRWEQAYRRNKRKGLRARPIPGRPCRLSARQREQLKVLLLGGPGAAGYTTDLWTLRRIGEVIRKRFGVRYSPVGVWAVAARSAVELAEAGTARPPARRGGHRPVEAARMAPVKKTLCAGARISCSSTKAGFS